jgi:transcriptional regulator with GAF, ATPase, and Fis domain
MMGTRLVGQSDALRMLNARIDAAALTASSVLIHGETGSGKELVACAIHERSERRGHRFVPVDCGALPDDLVESELFGYKRGAFTTALADKRGLFEEAHKGTLFLDEIGNTSRRFQVKLLRVLQNKQVRRLGEVVDRAFDVRVIAATNSDLRAMSRDGAFREDLFYRISVFAVHVPPLRERRTDIPLLANHVVDGLNAQTGLRRHLTPEALAKLSNYSYPGNVRELQNLIETAFFMSNDGDIDAEAVSLPSDSLVEKPAAEVVVDDFWESVARPYTKRLITRRQVENVIRRALEQTGGNYKKVVELFHMPAADYKRFMDFLRRHQCNVDFRPYRQRPR